MSSNVHQFALYCPGLNELMDHAQSDQLQITDGELHGRISHVLRMEVGQSLVLFDAEQSLTVEVANISKKAVTVKVLTSGSITPVMPSITMLLPILKREAFDDALYAMAELGVNVVQPITTAKTQTSWGSEKDYQRAQRIFVAAAEQSKQFALPSLEKVKTLADALKISNQPNKIFFDANGKPLKTLLANLKTESTVCLIGPEGDLTPTEKDQVAHYGFASCALTPTILRAQQAVALGVGVIRAWF
jgi:16S rRNA (uracil1498-N3)-methyltransferase